MTTSEDQFDDRYVRFREHADVRERVTALEGNSTQVMAYLARIEAMLNARAPSVAAADHNTLGIHHAAEAMKEAVKAFRENPPPQRNGNSILSQIGVLALGAVAAWVAIVVFT